MDGGQGDDWAVGRVRCGAREEIAIEIEIGLVEVGTGKMVIEKGDGGVLILRGGGLVGRWLILY